MDAEVRKVMEEKNRVEAAKAILERDNNSLKVSKIDFVVLQFDIAFPLFNFLSMFSDN